MSIDNRGILKKVLSKLKQGAKNIKKDFDDRDASIIEASQMQYSKKYGERMSPSYLEAQMDGIMDKKSKDYLNIKKRIKKEVS